MNSKSLRRLAADHGSLHTAGLPPNYLFPPSSDTSDLTALDILLAGPVGTPYAKGVWRLHLDIPPNYPTAPPTATFHTRLWHPNIDEGTGAVCVETLKRDWSNTLKLRDVLVTISCLLIQPNPASALNEAAGKLASEDWGGFCRRAKLMTEIHAAVPNDLAAEVKEAQMRGEDKHLEAEPKASRSQVNGKGKERAKATATTSSKIRNAAAGNEENMKRQGDQLDPESDPESDWIPRPAKSPTAIPAGKSGSNAFGIKGLDSMQLDTPAKRIFPSDSEPTNFDDKENDDSSDPFITVPSKHAAHSSFSLRVPPSSGAVEELMKFADQNPFSALQQPHHPHHLLIKEFSWSWQDSEVLYGNHTIKNAPTKAAVRKRMAGDDFEKQRAWELKRLKKTGYDLAKYNRGDFGAKTGMGRL